MSDLTAADWARLYLDHGFELVEVKPGTKIPRKTEWQNITTAPEHWERRPDDNIGVKLGESRLASLDLDDLDASRALFADFGIDLDALIAKAPTLQGNPSRLRVLFRATDQRLRKVALAWPSKTGELDANGKLKTPTVFELRGGHGSQDVLPPSRHPEGHVYQWLPGKALGEVDLPELPPVLSELWAGWAKWKPELERACPWAQRVEPKPASDMQRKENGDVIGAWNSAHDIASILLAHNYVPKGKDRFLAPGSSSGLPGVKILDSGRVYSHHGSDPLGDGYSHDAFDVFRLLEHGGDFKAAVRDAASRLGLRRSEPPPIPPRPDTQGERRAWLTPVGELLKEPAPLEWLIKWILLPSSLAMIVGDPQGGKSLLAIWWAACISMGKSWLGRRVKRGPVVIIAGEGHHGIRRRLKAWAIAHECEEELSQAPLFVSSSGTRLIDPKALQEVIAEIDAVQAEHGPPALVVIDTLHRNLGGEENSADDMGMYFHHADQIRFRYGATVLTVHHTGHSDKGRPRGSSGIHGANDIEYLLSSDGETRTLKSTKNKDMPTPPPLGFTLKQIVLPWRDADGDPETSVILEATDTPPSAQSGARASANIKLGVESFLSVLDASQAKEISLDEWREEFYARHTGDTPAAKRQAFHRVRADLVSERFLEVRNDLYSIGPGAPSVKWRDIANLMLARPIMIKP